MSNSWQPHWLKHARLPCPSLSPGVCSNSCYLSVMPSANHLILCHPLLLLPSIFPSFRAFSSESALHIKWPNITASASASVLSKNIQSEKGYLSSFFCIIPNLLHTTLNWKHLIMTPLSKQLFFRLSFLSSLPGPHFRLYHLLAGRPNHH